MAKYLLYKCKLNRTCSLSPPQGILRARRVLNELHAQLGARRFTEVYVEKMPGGMVSVTRYNPVTHESYLLVAHTSFSMGGDDAPPRVRVEGRVRRVVMEAFTRKVSDAEFARDETFVNGLDSYETVVRRELTRPDEAEMVEHYGEEASATVVTFKRRPNPGSVLVLHFTPLDRHADALAPLVALSEATEAPKELAKACANMSFLGRVCR